MLELAIGLAASCGSVGVNPRWATRVEGFEPVEPSTVTRQAEGMEVAGLSLQAGVASAMPMSTDQVVEFPPVKSEWTPADAKEFQVLSKAAIDGGLNQQQAREFLYLQEQKRRLCNPRPVEEIVWEYNQKQVTKRLTDALNEYVEFFTPAR